MSKYYRLNFAERIRISVYLEQGFGVSKIARKLNRSKSTISRELQRKCGSYVASLAQAESAFKRSEGKFGLRKIDLNPKLREEVFKGLKKRWSPKLISKMLKDKFPKDRSMQVSHEAIYTYIYVLPRGELRKELSKFLRQRKERRKGRSDRIEKRGRIPEMISIEERPKNVANRSLAGHWEGDLIIGKQRSSALATLVERKTRALILIPLKKDRTAKTVRKALEKAVRHLPRHMKLSLTYDQGVEMSEHKLFTKNTKMKVYFCHPASPWERGTCENTNGLIRDYFPKGTDFSKMPTREIKRVQDELNERPRAALNYKTPKEAINAEILSLR